MKEEAFERTLRGFNRRKPFKPFMVELASGSRLMIEHPEALIYRGRAAVYIDLESNITLFDNEGVTQLTDITGNGSRRSRRQA
jgi:hypothetical protein